MAKSREDKFRHGWIQELKPCPGESPQGPCCQGEAPAGSHVTSTACQDEGDSGVPLLSPVRVPLTCSSVFNNWGRRPGRGEGVSQTQTQLRKGMRQKGGARIVTNGRAECSIFPPREAEIWTL